MHENTKKKQTELKNDETVAEFEQNITENRKMEEKRT